MIDSGTSIMAGPYDEMKVLNEALGGIEVLPGLGEYFIFCDTIDQMPDVYWTINGLEYVMTPQEYILRVSWPKELGKIWA